MRSSGYIVAVFVATLVMTSFAIGQITPNGEPKATPKYDAALAKKLGADDNGMRLYVLVILKTGPNDATIKGKERDVIFAGHFANIERLADEGKLAVAGPFEKNDRAYRGLFIFAVATVDEAQKLVETDPGVKAGIFVAEMTQWYASAALMATPDIHKKITKPTPQKP